MTRRVEFRGTAVCSSARTSDSLRKNLDVLIKFGTHVSWHFEEYCRWAESDYCHPNNMGQKMVKSGLYFP